MKTIAANCRVLAVAIAFALPVVVHAAGTGTGATTRAGSGQRAAAEAAEVSALRPAFNTLLTADHDYDGHRVKAMKAIAAACRLMGTDIVPAGLEEKWKSAGPHPKLVPEPEVQKISDAQLQQVEANVKQVLTSIPAGKQPKVTERLQEAVNEIGLALAAK